MSQKPFRFVHAGDFRLELPPQGVADVPDHLRELFVESAYWAAERVFETVLAERAELLVLAGNLLDPRQTGPRGPLFLLEQFRRLAQRGVAVYWAGGRVDPPDAWPDAMPLPENVHRFPQGRVEQFIHRCEDTPLASVMGISRDGRGPIEAADFAADGDGLFAIAVAHGTAKAAALQPRGINYWALGGRGNRHALLSTPHAAHYAGSPQGRSPGQRGPHGCTVVTVDEDRRVRTSLAPTDVMRWPSERIVVDAAMNRDDLARLLRERMQALVEGTASIDLLVSWTIVGSGPLIAQLRRGALAAELLESLRKEFGFGPPAAWSLSLKAELPASLPAEWYEQETIRGDYLRAVRRYQTNADEPLDLAPYAAQEYQAVALAERGVREEVLREAAQLGVDLLSGEQRQ